MVEKQLDVGGAVVFWSIAEWTDRSRLDDQLTALDLKGMVPEPRPAPAALRSALEEVFGGPRVLIRPLASKDGFVVVQEDRGADSNRYEPSMTWRVRGEPPELSFEPWDSPADQVREVYQAHLERISALQVSAVLVRVVEWLGGTRLRPSGAVYWVPGNRLDDFARISQAIEQSAFDKPSNVYLLRHDLDADAIRAIRDAVVLEVQGETARLKHEVLSGELGARALESRQKQASELRDKVLLYEDLLSVGLKDLHVAIDQVEQASATTTLLLSSCPTESVTSATD